tara:strand:+ start:1147 stop:1302 length:156 start_codon:yes stop_codon:yes gene_type:complete
MKVKELIKQLEAYNQELDVIIWGFDLDDNYQVDFLGEDVINGVELVINIKV